MEAMVDGSCGQMSTMASVGRLHLFLQRLLNKSVDALALSLCFDSKPLMQVG